jgi:hypothetical protein
MTAMRRTITRLFNPSRARLINDRASIINIPVWRCSDLAALAHLRSLPYVDQNRLVVMGASFGGIQTMLAVERGSGYRVAVNCSGAAQTWRGSPDLRARLTAAASKHRRGPRVAPIFFVKRANETYRVNGTPCKC